METLVKTLKANVNIDVPRLGVLSLSMKNSNNYAETLQIVSGTSYTVKCISGTLYTSNTLQTVELAAGNQKTYNGSQYYYFAGNGEAVLEIDNVYELKALRASYIRFQPVLSLSKLAKYTKLYAIVNNTNTLNGRLEDYVNKASDYGKTSNITITNSWVYFGANREIHGTTYYCDFTTDSNVVTVKNTDASGSVLGTYNKTTKVWTYASA